MKKKKKSLEGDAELPFDLIASEILSRIPSKSDIGRCRCVCKEWNSYLSTPMFNRSHLRRHVSINDYKILLIDAQKPLPVNFNPNPAVHCFLASLDGLVCLGSKHRSAVPMVFWNPFTGAYKKLSSIPSMLSPRGYRVRDPIGFFIDSSNDYKLVCLIDSGWAHVYSHRLDSWRKIECSFSRQGDMWDWSHGTFCGQCVYFIEPQKSLCKWIICFDVETETFRKIPYPSVPNDAAITHDGTLVVLNGCLHMSVLSRILNFNGFLHMSVFSRRLNFRMHGDLWRLDDGHEEWVKVAAFRSGPAKRRKICTTSVGEWVAVLDEDDDSLKKMNTEDFTSYYRYFRSPSVSYRCSRVVYAETLVSP